MREGSATPSKSLDKTADASPSKSTPGGVLADPPPGRGIVEGMRVSRNGSIFVSRKLADSWIIQDGVALQVWMTLLLCATWAGRKQDGYDLAPGELDETERQIAQRIRATPSTVHRVLKRFEKNGSITRRNVGKCRRRSVVTIVNWASYQQLRSTDEAPMKRGRSTDEAPMKHPKEGKKERRGEVRHSPHATAVLEALEAACGQLAAKHRTPIYAALDSLMAARQSAAVAAGKPDDPKREGWKTELVNRLVDIFLKDRERRNADTMRYWQKDATAQVLSELTAKQLEYREIANANAA